MMYKLYSNSTKLFYSPNFQNELLSRIAEYLLDNAEILTPLTPSEQKKTTNSLNSIMWLYCRNQLDLSLFSHDKKNYSLITI